MTENITYPHTCEQTLRDLHSTVRIMSLVCVMLVTSLVARQTVATRVCYAQCSLGRFSHGSCGGIENKTLNVLVEEYCKSKWEKGLAAIPLLWQSGKVTSWSLWRE